MRHSLFYYVTLGFVFGIALAGNLQNFRNLLLIEILIAFVVGGYCLIQFEIYSNKILKLYSITFLIFCTILVSILGTHLFNLKINKQGDQQLKILVGKTIQARGVVVNDPVQAETKTKFIVELQEVKNKNDFETIEPTKIVVSDFLYSSLNYGDQILISGKIEKPEPFETESGSVFKYDKYLAKDNIYYTMRLPKIQVTGNAGNLVKKVLYKISHGFILKLNATIPFPESSLAAGLTVAGKGALPQDVLDNFQKSGTMQVVVLSGFNVTIIAEVFTALFSFLPKFFASCFGAASIILFTILAGGSATIVRGAIMAITVIVARYFKQPYDVHRSLILSAVIMLVFNPMLLQYDGSFQFSFVATLGLLLGTPIVTKYVKWVPEKLGLREATASGIATQFAVLPLILYSSGGISVYSLIANIMLFLVIPFTMLMCFIAGIGGFLSVTLVFPFAWLGWLFLRYELLVVYVFSHLPLSFFSSSTIPLWSVYLVYGCYGVIIWRFSRGETSKPETNSKILTLWT